MAIQSEMENSGHNAKRCETRSEIDPTSVAWQRVRRTVEAFHNASLPNHYLPHSAPSKTDCVDGLSFLSTRPFPTKLEVSCAATIFQFRKVLVGDSSKTAKRRAWEAYKAKLSPHPASPTPGFVYSARQTVRNLLPRNWARTYFSECLLAVPSLKSSIDATPGNPLYSREDFLRFTVHGEEVPAIWDLFQFPDNPREFKALTDDGKLRLITKATSAALVLRPLHTALYSALVRTGAVLRGPATSASLDGMTPLKGEEFCSADYKASTENFIGSNSLHLLSVLRDSPGGSIVPPVVWEAAIRFMGPALTQLLSPDGEVLDQFVARTGQRMGDLLSFPLLCLTNLVGLVRGLGWRRTRGLADSGLLKINGDDLAFRSTPSEIDRWQTTLPECGLVLESSKTLRHPRVVTLNSTFFLARRRRRPSLIWFARATAFIVPRPNSSSPDFFSRLRGRLPKLIGAQIDNYRDFPADYRSRALPVALQSFSWLLKHTPVYPFPEGLPLPAKFRVHLADATRASRILRAPPSSLRAPEGFFRVSTKPETQVDIYVHKMASQASAWFRQPAPEAFFAPLPPRPHLPKSLEALCPASKKRDSYLSPPLYPSRVGIGSKRPAWFATLEGAKTISFRHGSTLAPALADPITGDHL